MARIIDPTLDFHETGELDLTIEQAQEIPQSFLDKLKEARDGSVSTLAGDLHHAASIPVVVFEKWLREGYDAQLEPINKTLAKLRAEHLDYFIATNKRL